MVRQPKEVPVVQAHDERNQRLTILPVEGLNQGYLKKYPGDAHPIDGFTIVKRNR